MRRFSPCQFFAFLCSFASLLTLLILQALTKGPAESSHLELSQPDDTYSTLFNLATLYFHPDWLQNGLSKDYMDSLFTALGDLQASRGATLIIQVINGKIWVDRSRWTSPFAWDILRAQFILDQLKDLLALTPISDFEFALVTTPMIRYY